MLFHSVLRKITQARPNFVLTAHVIKLKGRLKGVPETRRHKAHKLLKLSFTKFCLKNITKRITYELCLRLKSGPRLAKIIIIASEEHE